MLMLHGAVKGSLCTDVVQCRLFIFNIAAFVFNHFVFTILFPV